MGRDIEELAKVIRRGNTLSFYNSYAWRKLMKEVTKEQHHECQLCKPRGKYTRSDVVHHVKHIRDFPELALSRTFVDENGEIQKNLVCLCDTCHMEVHPEKQNRNRKKQINEERW